MPQKGQKLTAEQIKKMQDGRKKSLEKKKGKNQKAKPKPKAKKSAGVNAPLVLDADSNLNSNNELGTKEIKAEAQKAIQKQVTAIEAPQVQPVGEMPAVGKTEEVNPEEKPAENFDLSTIPDVADKDMLKEEVKIQNEIEKLQDGPMTPAKASKLMMLEARLLKLIKKYDQKKAQMLKLHVMLKGLKNKIVKTEKIINKELKKENRKPHKSYFDKKAVNKTGLSASDYQKLIPEIMKNYNVTRPRAQQIVRELVKYTNKI